MLKRHLLTLFELRWQAQHRMESNHQPAKRVGGLSGKPPRNRRLASAGLCGPPYPNLVTVLQVDATGLAPATPHCESGVFLLLLRTQIITLLVDK